MRNLTARLKPSMLENLGIEATLRWHVREVGRDWPDWNWTCMSAAVPNDWARISR